MKLLPYRRVLCTPWYTHALCHWVMRQRHIRKVHACLTVTSHPAAALLAEWAGSSFTCYSVSAAHKGGGTDTEIRKLEKKILLPQFPAGLVVCCFTSAETIGLLGTGAQDGHLDFHTAPELCRESCTEGPNPPRPFSLTERLSPPLLLLSAPPHFSFAIFRAYVLTDFPSMYQPTLRN